MGTLTADVPRLAEHCDHKLPSSCRLTATPLCCACYDQRPHALNYRKYIDGVGYVYRGTRWQSYCWFCKSFWENRVTAAGLEPKETKIPEDPDQSEFVKRWFEWHQGYRLVTGQDGGEERQPLAGEPLKDADPGYLPRTHEQIRQNRPADLSTMASTRRHDSTLEDSAPHQSLDDQMDALLAEAGADDDLVVVGDQEGATPTSATTNRSEPPTAPPTVPSIPTIPMTSPNPANASPAPSIGTAPTIIREEARQRDLAQRLLTASEAEETARRDLSIAEERLRSAQTRLTQLQEQIRRIRRQQREMANVQRVFGTREDVQREDYVSPITNMFRRVAQWDRSQRERAGQSPDAPFTPPGTFTYGAIPPFPPHAPEMQIPPGQIASDPSHLRSYTAQNNLHEPFLQERLQQMQNVRNNETPSVSRPLAPPRPAGTYIPSSYTPYPGPMLPPYHPYPSQSAGLTEQFAEAFRASEPAPYAGLDGDARPEPKEDKDMQVKLDCKICLQQVAVVACLPCGHLSMCEWCAEQWVPSSEHDHTRPRERGRRCPSCRQGIRSRVKIYPG